MWDEEKWAKYGALGGIWFLVLASIGSFLGASPPSRSDSASEFAAWYVDNASTIQVGGFLLAVGVIGLVWWFGSVWEAMRRAEDSTRLAAIALIGFILSMAMALGGFTVHVGAAAAIGEIGEGVVVFGHISGIFHAFSSIGAIIMTTAIIVLAFRTGFLPKWIAQVGLVVVLASLISSAGVASDADFFATFGAISFISWAVWIVFISVHLFRRSPSTA